jgi:hypothetical protein
MMMQCFSCSWLSFPKDDFNDQNFPKIDSQTWNGISRQLVTISTDRPPSIEAIVAKNPIFQDRLGTVLNLINDYAGVHILTAYKNSGHWKSNTLPVVKIMSASYVNDYFPWSPVTTIFVNGRKSCHKDAILVPHSEIEAL